MLTLRLNLKIILLYLLPDLPGANESTHCGLVKSYTIKDLNEYHRKTSNISHTLVGNKIVDNSDVVGAPPVGAAPTTSSFST